MHSTSAISRRLFAAILCLAALGVFGVGVASAAEPSSMSEAREMGDPAATAPVLRPPEVFMYKGEEISESTWLEKELACMQTSERFICKDSEDEFKPVYRTRLRKKSKGKAVATMSACGTVELRLYRHKQYGGTVLIYYNYYTWTNVASGMNNATTSYRTGTAKAHLADFAKGGGYWYPGATGYCNYHSNISQPYPEWNDRISSMYRY